MMERDNLDLMNELKYGDLDLSPMSDAELEKLKAKLRMGAKVAANAKSSEPNRDEAPVAQPETPVAAPHKIGDWWMRSDKYTKGPRPDAPPGLA